MSGTILLTAGGTGGHLFPAQALADVLLERGYVVDLATDRRADKFGDAFPARSTYLISSDTIRSKNPVALARTGLKLLRGYWQASGILKRTKPSVVVGFGGYPTFPPMFAARMRGVPTILHEANAVMGRANRMLARHATAVATSFPEILSGDGTEEKQVFTGNPLRSAVITACDVPWRTPGSRDRFKLLVFGGSQGARFFSQMMPSVLEALPEELCSRIDLVQQSRPEDIDMAAQDYAALGMKPELKSFFTDLPDRIAQAHLVICRSGATSVSELAAIGRPSILVPLPGAIDQDQSANARTLESIGGAVFAAEASITPSGLAETIAGFMRSPQTLSTMAEAARKEGRPNAVGRLADLVEHVASGEKAASFLQGVPK
ncbi:MAG: undecaprenyldiphospho-muramoylpentapeptide beta-N-acetylglucosaminyltransferase [Stappiaceae bacterium]